jgi:hypothetical protein
VNLSQALDEARRLRVGGRLAEAAARYREIIQIDPGHVLALMGLAEVALDGGQLEAAVALLKQAIAIRGDFAECWTVLGSALREGGNLDGAGAAYRRAKDLDPENPAVYNNLANVLKDRGELAEAAAAYRKALALRPDFVDAWLNLGIVLLLAGDLGQGFLCYEARRELRELAYLQPRWGGEELGGRRILLHTRQGLGDVIQFVRYAPMVAGRGGEVVVACKPELKRLIQSQAGISRVVSDTEGCPPVDLQCPLLSLPYVMGTTLQTIPAVVPYLGGTESDRAFWRERLAREPGGLRVGLNWAGNLLPRRNRKRTFDGAAMGPLAKVGGVRFYSLQRGPDGQMPPPGFQLVDWTGELKDLADTAALISNLDLVITCDTSVAHLAGALGGPVWVGLPFAPDWRWLLGRSDSPWYPTMRLFRQQSAGDWKGVFEAMAGELARVSGRQTAT